MHILKQKDIRTALILLCLLTTAIYLPLNYHMIFSHPHNDFHDHIAFARSLTETGTMPEHIEAHPIWQICILAISKISSISLESSAVLLQVVIQIFLAALLFIWFQKKIRFNRPFYNVVLTISVLFVSQIMVLAIWDDLFYLGYIGINTYHNPTINFLKPFALLLFIYSVDILEGKSFTWWHILSCATVVFFSTLIKPNLIICVMPALAILLLYRFRKKQFTDWKFTILGIYVPAVLVLTWQFLTTYDSDQSGILFAPFRVMDAYSDFLVIKFLLSIWFPLILTAVYWRAVLKDMALRFAWLGLIFGAAYTYLLAEGGDRLLHGNWGWSGEIMMFLLFIVAVSFFFGNWKELEKTSTGWIALVLGFIPHVVAGIVYCIYTINSGTFL